MEFIRLKYCLVCDHAKRDICKKVLLSSRSVSLMFLLLVLLLVINLNHFSMQHIVWLAQPWCLLCGKIQAGT